MEHQDKNISSLNKEKAEKYLHPKSDGGYCAHSATRHRSQAGIKHGIGIFLIILGTWWFLQELGIFPDVSLVPVAVLLIGIWFLKTSTKEDRKGN